MLTTAARFVPRTIRVFQRAVSTLPNNPDIKVFKEQSKPGSHILTYLDTNPPSNRIAIGTTTAVPPTPQSFTENHTFTKILNEVITEHGDQDEDVVSAAQAYVSQGGFNLGSGGALFQNQRSSRGGSGGKQGGAGGASSQGGAGGGGRGGWVHLSDRRNPPDFGRIAWPEDILGSVEVDDSGKVVGKVQPSGTYRVVTNEGILGLSPYLTRKLVERLEREESKESN